MESMVLHSFRIGIKAHTLTRRRDYYYYYYYYYLTIKENNITTTTYSSSSYTALYINVISSFNSCAMLHGKNLGSCCFRHLRYIYISTVSFGSADKVTGICSEEKTRTLA